MAQGSLIEIYQQWVCPCCSNFWFEDGEGNIVQNDKGNGSQE